MSRSLGGAVLGGMGLLGTVHPIIVVLSPGKALANPNQLKGSTVRNIILAAVLALKSTSLCGNKSKA